MTAHSLGPLAAIVQILGPLGGLAGIGALFLIPQQRRKIDAGVTKEKADAAATLTGSALLMVQSAESRAQRAEERAEELSEALEAAQRQWRLSLQDAQWEIESLRRREADLEDVLRAAGLEVPPRRRAYDARPPAATPGELEPGPGDPGEVASPS